jgi:hypothetical protein
MRDLAGVAVLILVVAGEARADSDGYFCVGKDYIAYQFGLAAPSPGPHRLTIVRFGRDGLHAPQVVDLPQFQVHGMACGDTTVRVAAFDAIYTVTLASTPRLVGRADIPPTDHGRFPSAVFVQRNLAQLSRARAEMRADRIRLGVAPDGHAFELVIVPTPSSKACVVNIVSTLVELDAAGGQVVSRDVFRGEAPRECGGTALAAQQRVAAVNRGVWRKPTGGARLM